MPTTNVPSATDESNVAAQDEGTDDRHGPHLAAGGVLKQPKKVLLRIADDKCMKRFGPEATERIIADSPSFRVQTPEDLAKFGIPEDVFPASIKGGQHAANPPPNPRRTMASISHAPSWPDGQDPAITRPRHARP